MARIPDPFEKLPVEVFRAVFGKVWSRSAVVSNRSPEHTEQAHRAGNIQPDQCIRTIQTLWPGRRVPAFKYPAFFSVRSRAGGVFVGRS